MVTGTLPPTINRLGSVTTLADGTEQNILQQVAGIPEIIRGYVDLTEMQAGDTTIIRLYVMMASLWRLYGQQTYNNAQPIPIVYVTGKPKSSGLRVTIQQMAGAMRSYISEFFTGGG